MISTENPGTENDVSSQISKPKPRFIILTPRDYRKFLTNDGNERSKEKQGLATNTVRRMIGRSKQFFNAAIKHELITRNPFSRVKHRQ